MTDSPKALDDSHASLPLENVFVSLDGTPATGNERAVVGIVEFGDYECPYSSLHASSTLPQMIANYVKAGKVRYFFKDFPLEASHPQAFEAAEAARCAGEQGKYWEMHDRLLKNQQLPVTSELPSNLDLDVPQFQQCLSDAEYGSQVRKDIQEAKKLGVKGTPTFFVGTLDAHGSRLKAVKMLYGYQPFTVFQQTLDQMLSSQGAERRTQ